MRHFSSPHFVNNCKYLRLVKQFLTMYCFYRNIKEFSVVQSVSNYTTAYRVPSIQGKAVSAGAKPADNKYVQPQKNEGRKHLSYWRSLGISSLFGASAMGFATIFCQKWRTSIGFGAIIAGLCMLFDLPDTLFIGRK